MKIAYGKYLSNNKTLIFLLYTLFCSFVTQAQEVIRYLENESDTAVGQVDTTAKPPAYKGGENEFFRDLEIFLGRNEWSDYFNSMGDVVTFEFTVRADGTTDRFKIIRSTNSAINIPLKMAVLKTDKWEARIKEGERTDTRMVYSLNLRAINEFPYIEIRKEEYYITEPASKHLKWFVVIGALIVMGTLLIL